MFLSQKIFSSVLSVMASFFLSRRISILIIFWWYTCTHTHELKIAKASTYHFYYLNLWHDIIWFINSDKNAMKSVLVIRENCNLERNLLLIYFYLCDVWCRSFYWHFHTSHFGINKTDFNHGEIFQSCIIFTGLK